MWRILRTRLQQGHRTVAYPSRPPVLPERFRGRPVVDGTLCPDDCRACSDACPTDAIRIAEASEPEKGPTSRLELDLGRCLFCQDCVTACPEGAIRHTTEHRLAARHRDDLVMTSTAQQEPDRPPRMAPLDDKLLRLFRRSLKLRQVSAGGCNACEADVNVLGTIVFDLGRFGIQFVASPRHADGLLITGPVTENMKLALQKTYDAVPPPKIVIAVGACAISGGPYAGHEDVHDGASSVVPVDLFIPGCPPHPYTILDGLLSLLDRLERRE